MVYGVESIGLFEMGSDGGSSGYFLIMFYGEQPWPLDSDRHRAGGTQMPYKFALLLTKGGLD